MSTLCVVSRRPAQGAATTTRRVRSAEAWASAGWRSLVLMLALALELPAQRPCFDLDALTPRARAAAETMLQMASDGEGLYTLQGGLKPVSSSMGGVTIPVHPGGDSVAQDSLALLRTAAAALRCGAIEVSVMEYASTFTRADSSRYRSADTYIVHRASLRRAIARHATFWDSLGVDPSTPPAEVLARVERAATAPRWRGYGYLFGYPDAAVDFFVWAGESQARGGEFVPRDFRRIETFRKFPAASGAEPTLSSFVYAVPRGAEESAADRALREAAAPIYAAYVARRTRFLADDGAGIVALWREVLAADAAQATGGDR
jgi:hypothetical protein